MRFSALRRQMFTTTVATLRNAPAPSLFSAMFSGRHPLKPDAVRTSRAAADDALPPCCRAFGGCDVVMPLSQHRRDCALERCCLTSRTLTPYDAEPINMFAGGGTLHRQRPAALPLHPQLPAGVIAAGNLRQGFPCLRSSGVHACCRAWEADNSVRTLQWPSDTKRCSLTVHWIGTVCVEAAHARRIPGWTRRGSGAARRLCWSCEPRPISTASPVWSRRSTRCRTGCGRQVHGSQHLHGATCHSATLSGRAEDTGGV